MAMDLNNNNYIALDVTYNEKILKKRSSPQTVHILTEEFNSYMDANNADIFSHMANLEWLYDKIPENLEGKLRYKDHTWDFMAASYNRIGMIAAVSEKVKNIFESLKISDSDYALKPIKVKGTDLTYYLLFVKHIPEYKVSMKDSEMCLSLVPSQKLYFQTYDEMKRFETSASSNSLRYLTIALPCEYQKKDIIAVQGSIFCFFSNRIIDEFEKNNVKGYDYNYREKLIFV